MAGRLNFSDAATRLRDGAKRRAEGLRPVVEKARVRGSSAAGTASQVWKDQVVPRAESVLGHVVDAHDRAVPGVNVSLPGVNFHAWGDQVQTLTVEDAEAGLARAADLLREHHHMDIDPTGFRVRVVDAAEFEQLATRNQFAAVHGEEPFLVLPRFTLFPDPAHDHMVEALRVGHFPNLRANTIAFVGKPFEGQRLDHLDAMAARALVLGWQHQQYPEFAAAQTDALGRLETANEAHGSDSPQARAVHRELLALSALSEGHAEHLVSQLQGELPGAQRQPRGLKSSRLVQRMIEKIGDPLGQVQILEKDLTVRAGRRLVESLADRPEDVERLFRQPDLIPSYLALI